MIIKVNPEENSHKSYLNRNKSSEVLKWSNKYNAYAISSNMEVKELLIVDRMGYLQYEAGNYTAIYPNYDKDTTSIDCDYSYGKSDLISTEYTLTVSQKTECDNIPFGTYYLTIGDHGETLLKPFELKIKNSSILVNTHDIKSEVLGFLKSPGGGIRKNKKGMLLFGPPGNGKTSSLMEMAECAEKEQFYVIMLLDSDLTLKHMRNLKKSLEGNPVVFILEEITERIKIRPMEEILTFLDGEESWDKSVTIATTNYPEELPPNLVDRPGRLDTFIKFDNPTREQVREMLIKADLEPNEVPFFRGKDLSFDYISYIISLVKSRSGWSVEEVIKSEESKRKMISETFKGSIGI